MSNANIEELVSKIIPPLSSDYHKGQAGRIGIIGGSKDYTGAPYFAAISALKVGGDLVHVFCTKDASQVIKAYSPELIVHPILDSASFSKEFLEHLPHLHSLVIGPGLGRETSIFDSIRDVIESAKSKDVPIVFDADALFFLNNAPEVIHSYKKAILTPNKIEFGRLYKSVTKNMAEEEYSKAEVQLLAELLGNVTILKKGSVDIISDGVDTLICNEPGSLRRCGGQGDLLCGSLGTFHYWAHRTSINSVNSLDSSLNHSMIAAFGACLLTRRCSYLAFQKFGRSSLTTNMISEIHNAFSGLFH
ncbi:ATP-dependent (S)-NAD(P)H-hydrate dehydratase-like [Uloborus diversus]|uniref:ATP-dependent (S)-NAD(P)H-hydrate dehydratase-like n=1 Tax=Uloborus diversus TaxID=327109 RepID=UPI0024091C40|nr:ATP-dependent (S)-NAD(P)H-hydrate dehydratase-like [Uloborus diversus]